MINCKEIAEYLRYAEDNPKKINRDDFASDEEDDFLE